MLKKRFRLHLQAIHKQSGFSVYDVAEALGMSKNTVWKYVRPDVVEFDYLPSTVLDLCEFYGVDWRDKSILEVFEESTEGQQKPLLVAA